MDELTKLFAAYREAVPDPEPSANFMPDLWRKIEARRSPVLVLRRFAQAFVTVAAVFALLIATVVIPRMQNATVYAATYIDVLANDQSTDMAYADTGQARDVPQASETDAPPLR